MPTLSEKQERRDQALDKKSADAVLFFFKQLGFKEAQINQVINDLPRYARAFRLSIERFSKDS